MTGVDYRNITPPSDTDPEEYHYTHRRAEILALIEDAGHPRAVNQEELARRYGVSQPQISSDMDTLREYLVDAIDTTRVDALTELVFQKAIRELIEAGEYLDATRVVADWNDWLHDRNHLPPRPPDRVDAEVTHGDGTESESYRVIPDDADTEAAEQPQDTLVGPSA